MNAECFLDANILVYAFASAPAELEKKNKARQIIAAEDIGVSAQVLQEFYVTVTKKLKQPISSQEALQAIDSFALFPLVPTDVPLIRQGAALGQRYQISFWDGAVLAAAERLSASVLFTEDLNHLQRFGSVQVINPFKV